METVKSEFLLTKVCHGCLSNDRETVVSKETSQLYLHLLDNGVSSERKALPLCWECRAVLRKIKRFQNQIKNAQISLLLYNWETSLSNLQTTSKCDYDHEYTFEEKEPQITEKQPNFPQMNKIVTPILREPQLIKNDQIKIEIVPTEASELLLSTEEVFDCQLSAKEELDDFDHYDDSQNVTLDITRKEKEKRQRIKPTSIKQYEKYAFFSKEKDKVKAGDLKKYYKTILLNDSQIEEYFNARLRRDRSFARLKYRCEECLLGYNDKKDFRRHNSIHHNSSTDSFKCTECKMQCPTLETLAQHWMIHTGLLQCLLCGDLHQSTGEMRKHVNRAHTCRFTCKECGNQTRTLREFSLHYKNVHEKLVCDHCGKGFYQKRVLESHMRRNHLPAKCDICGRQYAMYHTLEVHLRTVHPEVMKGAYNRDASYCVECDRQYPSVYKYRKHLKQSVRHTPRMKVRIPCPECGKVFSRTNYMNNHYRLFHSKDTKHYCQLCNKLFVTGYAARKHKQYVHDKQAMPKNKICDICGRGFSTNRILDNHRRTHTGERPYKCPHCTAAFAQNTAMQTHIKSQHKSLIPIEIQLHHMT